LVVLVACSMQAPISLGHHGAQPLKLAGINALPQQGHSNAHPLKLSLPVFHSAAKPPQLDVVPTHYQDHSHQHQPNTIHFLHPLPKRIRGK